MADGRERSEALTPLRPPTISFKPPLLIDSAGNVSIHILPMTKIEKFHLSATNLASVLPQQDSIALVWLNYW